MPKVQPWDVLRLCPKCGFHKYRLFEVGEPLAVGRRKVRMSCDQCGMEREVPCPGCATVGNVSSRPVVYRNGQPMKQAGCDTCNLEPSSGWMVRLGDAPKRKASLRKYVVARQATCADCGCQFMADGEGDVHHVAHFGRGGPDILANLERLCEDCHLKQHGKQRRAG